MYVKVFTLGVNTMKFRDLCNIPGYVKDETPIDKKILMTYIFIGVLLAGFWTGVYLILS
jgi:hypothetical protein